MNDRTCRYLITMALLFYSIPASARILHVPEEYPTIQEGIDAAENGDTVLVAPGLYVETFTIENKNILLTSAEAPEITEIRGFLILGSGLDSTFVLRGFTLTPDQNSSWYGILPIIQVVLGSPIIEGNIIKLGRNENTLGGGLRVSSPNVIIRNNIVRSNYAVSYGGISCGPNTIVERNVIAYNSAGSPSHGGQVGGIAAGTGIIRYNLIINNIAMSGGTPVFAGGMLVGATSSCEIYNNTIAENWVDGPNAVGGGLYIVAGEDLDEVMFRNNIIAFNPAGGGVYAELADSTDLTWDYNLVFGNGGGDYIGIEPGPNDIQADPLFVDRFSGDYRLLPNSPCIDAGDPDFPLDPDGTRADIGAYYFDQTVGIDDPGEPSGPYKFRLRQNYPNPFNSQTIISYYLPEEAVVSLHIFSIAGHFVKALANKEAQLAGEHRYIWDGRDKNRKMVSTGIYFYELYVDDYRESKAMIMIK